MTRVLHVLDHSLPLHSGYTFRTRAILKAQERAGIEVRGITGLRHVADGPPMEEAEGLTFHRTPANPDGTRETGGVPAVAEIREVNRLAKAIEDLAKDWRPDVLHAHSPALCGLAAVRAGARLGIPVVYEIRAFWEDAAVGNGQGREGSIKYRMTRALENRVVARADAVFTICEGLRDDLITRGFDGGRIGISPNGVDMSVFGEPAKRDPALAQDIGLGEGPVIGFIGSFYDYEGLDDLIAALPLLQEHQPGAQLLLTGGGPMEAALRTQAEASPCSKNIHFTGRIPHEQVERYYALIDILAYPRKRSRLTDLVTPLKPLEAMAQRRLVAASDVGGHRELMVDGVTGTLFPADEPGGIAEALAALIDNRADWDAMKERSFAHVATRHDWAANIHRYQSVYHHLLAHRLNRSISAAA